MIPAPWLAGSRNNRLILNRYPAAAAYSLRKLYKGSTKALRVRRSSDSSEQDIGYNGTDLDQSALTTFCGANDGFVVKWYNQMDNGASANFVQATAGQQPMIVSAGTVLTRYGKPMIQMDTTSKYLYNEDLTLFKNKNYNRVYFTLSKPDTNRYDGAFPLSVRSDNASYQRFYVSFETSIPHGSELFCCAVPDNRATGTVVSDVDAWYMFDDNGGTPQFGGSISTLNIMANWNAASSGVAVGSGQRQSVTTRHASDLQTSASDTGAADQNTVNADAIKFTLGGYWNGASIAGVSTNLGYNELFIYDDATYHGNDSDISANIAAYY